MGSGLLAHSDDHGVTWTNTYYGYDTNHISAPIGEIFNQGSKLILSTNDTTYYTISSANNGTTWKTERSIPSSEVDLHYNNGTYLYFSGFHMFTSSDTNTWSHVNCFVTDNITDVSYSGGSGTYIAVGWGRLIVRSTDGMNWSWIDILSGNIRPGLNGAATVSSLNFYSVANDGGSTFVIVGYVGTFSNNTGSILTSTDGGLTWMEQTFANTWLLSVAYGNGKFVAIANPQPSGTQLLYSSNDGVSWSTSTNADTFVNIDFFDNVSKFIAGSNNSSGVHVSSDGITWTIIPVAPSSQGMIKMQFAHDLYAFDGFTSDIDFKIFELVENSGGSVRALNGEYVSISGGISLRFANLKR